MAHQFYFLNFESEIIELHCDAFLIASCHDRIIHRFFYYWTEVDLKKNIVREMLLHGR